jgi:3-oxoacyl-[acyl-carrier protein] reductase
MNIQDAKVLITGGSSGIGLEIARLLRTHGARIVICGTDTEKLQAAASELGVLGFRADVSIEREVEDLFQWAITNMEGLNVLINNAGIGRFSPLVDTSLSDFQRIWEVNVRGAFLAGRQAARYFVEQGSGNIINIGSTASIKGFASGSAYVASKFALAGLTDCWRTELRKHNVRVMQINPSEVLTDFIRRAGYQSPAINPERKLTPTEIAHVAHAMLAMNDVGFVTDASIWATNP